MFAQKYASPTIAQLPAETVMLHAKGLLFRIHTITGWSLPDSDFFLNTLVSEFRNLLMESYKELNVDEIAYAVRNYGLEVKDWGKNINLSLIDKPIAEYRRIRKCLSEMEERRVKQQEAGKPSEEKILSDRREFIETRYQDFVKGERKIVFYPTDGIDLLILDGFCEADYHTEYLEAAMSRVITRLKRTQEDFVGRGMHAMALETKAEIEKITTADKKVEMLAKKMALYACFEFFMADQREHIYIKE